VGDRAFTIVVMIIVISVTTKVYPGSLIFVTPSYQALGGKIRIGKNGAETAYRVNKT